MSALASAARRLTAAAALLCFLAACDVAPASPESLRAPDAAPPSALLFSDAASSEAPFLESYVGFAMVGHSNAIGKGDSLESWSSTPLPPNVAFAFERATGTFVPMRDPVYTANTGSAWPAFAQEFHDQTCRGSFLVSVGQRGSTLTREADVSNIVKYWVPSENPADYYHRLLLPTVQRAYDEALAQGGSRVQWGGALMWLGVPDSRFLGPHPVYADSVYTLYHRALMTFLDAYQEDFGIGKVYIITDVREIVNGVPVDHIPYQEVRQATRDACAAHPLCVLASDEAYTYPASDYQDASHLNQGGLIKIGQSAARGVAEDIGALPGCNG